MENVLYFRFPLQDHDPRSRIILDDHDIQLRYLMDQNWLEAGGRLEVVFNDPSSLVWSPECTSFQVLATSFRINRRVSYFFHILLGHNKTYVVSVCPSLPEMREVLLGINRNHVLESAGEFAIGRTIIHTWPRSILHGTFPERWLYKQCLHYLR
jgi:hypothetical protein